MEEEGRNLHILMLPWLAMGHILPFFELSKRLAHRGIKISFFSTPSNILRLPSIPKSLTPFINLIPCSLPSIRNLPSNIENTIDLRFETERSLLQQAYADFEQYLIDFLSIPCRSKPNWIFYDFTASSWAPSLASRFNFNSAFFSIFNAPTIAFLDYGMDCESPEELTRVPDLLPFATTVNLGPFEARRILPMIPKKSDRAESLKNSQLLLLRTCKEFDAKWIDSLPYKYTPVGVIPPLLDDHEETETWATIREWLDKREDFSVIYAAFGSEAKLTKEQIDEIGLGLELSGLPFVWVLQACSPSQDFVERMAGRGLVWNGWVPQARLLAHPAVGGFLTHAGWSSIVEAMANGTVMVVLPMMLDQGLNAKHIVESGYAVEVEKNDEDGSFSGEDIGRKLRMVMVDEEGEELRKKAIQGKEIFGNEKLQDEYIDKLVKKLWENQEMKAQPV